MHICRREQERGHRGYRKRALLYLDDPDMEELPNRIIGKLRNMKDEEFEWPELIEAD